jgi:sugar lactone lactonase YvrE
MASALSIDCVLDIKAKVGECPMWHVGEQRLYFVDIGSRTLNRFDPATGTNEVRQFDQALGSFGFRSSGGMIGGFRDDGFCTFDFETGSRTQIVNPEPGNDAYRFNDGRVDPYGAFWCGTMREPIDQTDRGAVIYRCGPDGSADAKVSGLGCSNGIVFDAERRRFYCADTTRRIIWVFDHDPETGDISNRRIFANTEDVEGRPDGACLDSEGCYWSACVSGWQIVRYTPDGKIDRTIPVPVQRPTMCAFGGADLDVMYITSIGPNENDPRPMAPGQPHAGGVFACRPGVQGVPEGKFKG